MLSTGGNAAISALRILAAVLMIGIGLYLPGWWKGLAHLEARGTRLWRPVLRILARIPADTPGGRLVAGAAWGLLPCGIVYSVLGLALGSGSALQGAGLMASFGLGTLPFVLGTGTLVQTLGNRLADAGIRRLAGGLMIGMGVVTLYTLLGPEMHTGSQHFLYHGM